MANPLKLAAYHYAIISSLKNWLGSRMLTLILKTPPSWLRQPFFFA